MRSSIGNDARDPVFVTQATRNPDGSYSAATANPVYTLASNQALAANSGSAPVTSVQRGSYIFDAQFTGTSIQLQSLGSDGSTWRNVGAALTQSGAIGVQIGQGASVRVYNPNGSGLTGVSANLT